MINVLFRYLLVIAGLLLSQEIFSTGQQPSGQNLSPLLSLIQTNLIHQSGAYYLKSSSDQNRLYVDVASFNLHIEDEEEEDHQPTCKRSKLSSLTGYFSRNTIFQFSSFASRAFSFTFHPAFYQNLTCIRYLRFQVFRL